ncbi:MotA/TolQ/ExbB proton channel family protein [Bacteroidota bacterium]
MQFFMQGGIFMWVILFFLLVDIFYIIKGAKSIFSSGDTDKTAADNDLNIALWMGIISGVIGLLGTMLGFYYAAGAISNATDISVAIVWGGVRIALTSFIFGLWIFILTAIVVILLKAKLK